MAILILLQGSNFSLIDPILSSLYDGIIFAGKDLDIFVVKFWQIFGKHCMVYRKFETCQVALGKKPLLALDTRYR